jgi:hypothetical protein
VEACENLEKATPDLRERKRKLKRDWEVVTERYGHLSEQVGFGREDQNQVPQQMAIDCLETGLQELTASVANIKDDLRLFGERFEALSEVYRKAGEFFA